MWQPAASLEPSLRGPLRRAFRLRVARLEDHPANLELPAERGERLRWATARGDRRLPVPHQLLRQHPQPGEIARQTKQDVRRLLAEHQGARDRPRPAHLASDHPATTQLTVADRNVPPRLPQIALDQLTRPIDRPLERPRYNEPGTNLADEVIKDRLPTLIAQLRRELPQALRLDPRIRLQLLTNPILEEDRPQGLDAQGPPDGALGCL
jgi:hypothetical protein